MKRAATKHPIVRFLPSGLVKRPLLAFGVLVLPILTSFLPAFVSEPRDLVFSGFLTGCLMCVIVFKKR